MKPRIRTICAFLLILFLAVWIGGGLLTDFVTVPALFALLSRSEAARIGAAFFSKWNYLEAVLGAGSILLAFALGLRGWGTRRRHIVATSILIGMTLISLVFLIWFTPHLIEKWNDVAASVDVESHDADSPERRAFRTAHTTYAGLDVLKMLGGMVVFWLLAGRRDRG